MSHRAICRAIVWIAAVFVSPIVLSDAPARGAVAVTGLSGYSASIYTNPFDPSGDGVTSGAEATTISSGAIGGGSVSATSLVNVVTRIDARTADLTNVGARLSSGTATQGYMQYAAASAFNAGTIIGDQFVGAGFVEPMSYRIQLGGTTYTTYQNGPGTHGVGADAHPIQVTTLPSLVSATQMRVEMDLADYSDPDTTRYGDFDEAIVLPETLARIPVTNITASSTTFQNKSGIYDLDGSFGWAGSDNATFTLDFGETKTIRALVVADFENLSIDVDISNSASVTVANLVTNTPSNNDGDYALIRFDTPVTTSSLTFSFNGGAGLREVIALEAVATPEPASFGILSIGVAAALLRRRAR